MISIKDYAKQKGVSYEAIRKQVHRYREDLGEHLVKKNRIQYLDEEAVAFLDARRAENPVIILEASKDEELLALRREKEALLVKVAELQDALLREKDRVSVLQEEKIALLEDKTTRNNGFFSKIFKKK